jgi:hypothetical protein
MVEPKDRKSLLLQSKSFNGIDFVEVVNDAETALRVHFLNAVSLAGSLGSPPVTITGGESIPTVTVNPIYDYADWDYDSGHLVLNLSVAAPGDFSTYTLAISSPRLDLFFNQTQFSFKALCPSDLDCQSPPGVCPVLPSDAPPIDYLSKDFLSFRQALLDFSTLRYSEWQERSEADFGMMFLEALSSLADDLSYTQDRIAAEATLDTATQRRSVIRHARLVDYEPRPAVTSSVLLQFDVTPTTTSLPDGVIVSAPGPDGTPVPFETGDSLQARLIDPTTNGLLAAPPSRPVSSLWNSGAIQPYWLDDSQQCLLAGSVQMYVLGHNLNFTVGQALLINTTTTTTADPPLRQIVHIAADPIETCDPLYPPGDPNGTPITLIQWDAADALTADRDLAMTTLAGNLIPATQGLTLPPVCFVIPPATAGSPPMTAALVRTGPNDTPADPSLQYLYPLTSGQLVWFPATDPTQYPQPELVLLGPVGDTTQSLWTFERWLLESEPFDTAYTVDPVLYSLVAGTVGNTPSYDYDGDTGSTIRFGDGVFGALPIPGTVFKVTCRIGGGQSTNVAADAITQVGSAWSSLVTAATNPLPATGGLDAETSLSVSRMAPQAFRAVQYRAVLPADYAAAAETLPWVLRAGTVFRWTGSWHTVFTTPDPLNSQQITVDQRTALITLLNRYRMAGYESYVPSPQYVSLDLVVGVCALPTAFRGNVEASLLTSLGSGPTGFFNPNNFTFGQPLELSTLEAAIQQTYGVAGVTCVRYRVRGRNSGFVRMGDTVSVGIDEIIRCDNDPSLAEHGTLQVVVEGGK